MLQTIIRNSIFWSLYRVLGFVMIYLKSCLILIFSTVHHLAVAFQRQVQEKKGGEKKRSSEKVKQNRFWIPCFLIFLNLQRSYNRKLLLLNMLKAYCKVVQENT